MGQQGWVCRAIFFICFSGFSALSHTQCFGMLLSIGFWVPLPPHHFHNNI